MKILFKTCCRCKKELPISEFGANKSLKDGLNQQCRLCVKAKNALYYSNRKLSLKERFKHEPEHKIIDILKLHGNAKPIFETEIRHTLKNRDIYSLLNHQINKLRQHGRKGLIIVIGFADREDFELIEDLLNAHHDLKPNQFIVANWDKVILEVFQRKFRGIRAICCDLLKQASEFVDEVDKIARTKSHHNKRPIIVYLNSYGSFKKERAIHEAVWQLKPIYSLILRSPRNNKLNIRKVFGNEPRIRKERQLNKNSFGIMTQALNVFSIKPVGELPIWK